MEYGLPDLSSTSPTPALSTQSPGPLGEHLGLTVTSCSLQVNTFMSFLFPMLVISILNTVIANKLTVMVHQAAEQGRVCTVGTHNGLEHSTFNMTIEPGRVQALRHGVLVLRT